MKNFISNFNWEKSLMDTYEVFARHLIELAPKVIGALGLLVLGWVAAHLLRLLTRKGMRGLDLVLRKFIKPAEGRRQIPQQSYSVIISKIVYWSVLLFFVASAFNLLEWKLFSGWMDSLVRNLPNLFMGLIIILGGVLVAGSVRSAVQRASAGAGLSNGELLALIAQVFVLLTTAMVGIAQIGIQTGFLTTLIAVTVGIFLAGASLAFGIGAQYLVANIIGAQLTRKHCRIGDTLKISGIEGEILEVTQTSIIIDGKGARYIVPAKLFQNEISVLSHVDPETPRGSLFGSLFKKEEKSGGEDRDGK